MAAVIDVWNLALQKLGATALQSVNDQSSNARACSRCYDMLRLAELRKNRWGFAIKRFQLPASLIPPAFGPANSFPLPTGWVKVLPPDSFQNLSTRDWIIEGGMIFTNQTAPLNVRCVMDVTDTSQMDPLFIDALASRMAEGMCEQITQSNTKKAGIAQEYKDAISEAKKGNAIEQVPQESPDQSWITARM